METAEASIDGLVEAQVSAEAGLAAAVERVDLSTSAQQQAIAEFKECERALKQARSSRSSFEQDQEVAEQRLVEAKANFESFLEGPLKCFAELVQLDAPAAEIVEQKHDPEEMETPAEAMTGGA